MNTDTMTERPDSNIYASIFGTSPEVQAAAAARDASFQDWLNSRKQAVEQQRTDDVRMARLNAIGNVLTTMVQPLGWAVGGATGGVQPIDNRQYLQAFERAMKANDDLRNIGTLEGEYQFKLADENYRRQLALQDYEQKARMQAQIQQDYAQARHDYTMAEIEARNEGRLDVAKYKAGHKVTGKTGIPVEDKMLQTAWTQYMAYKKQYETDRGRGIVRQEEKFPTFEEWVGQQFGWNIKQKSGADTTPQDAKPADKPATKPSGSSKVPPSRQNSGGSGNASAVAGANNSKTPPSKRNK